MADVKISELPASTVPLADTEVLPIVQSGSTKKVSVANLTAGRQVDAQKLVVTNPVTGAVGPEIVLKNIPTGSDVNAGGRISFEHANTSRAFYIETETKGSFGRDPNLVFKSQNDTGTGFVESLRITNVRNVQVTTGNLVIGTAGKGIDFSADGQAAGMTSELLDDYEEGTWTPVYLASVSGTATYGIQTGYYRKIGSVVFAAFRIRGNKDTLSGDLRIDGLPYAPAPNETTNSVSISWAANFASNMPELRALASGSSIRLYKGATDTTPVRLTDADLSGASVNNNEIRGVAIYFTA
jgi:hypothetical protein